MIDGVIAAQGVHVMGQYDTIFRYYFWLHRAQNGSGNLLSRNIGIGQFQPYVRYVENTPDGSNFGRDSDLYELGTNYIISGHNAKVNFNYTSGDASLTGRAGSDVNAFSAGVQFQF